MKLEQTFEVAAPIDAVWRALIVNTLTDLGDRTRVDARTTSRSPAGWRGSAAPA